MEKQGKEMLTLGSDVCRWKSCTQEGVGDFRKLEVSTRRREIWEHLFKYVVQIPHTG